MSKKIEQARGVVGDVETTANDGTVTRHGSGDDIIARYRLDLEVREYGFPPIFAGFQTEWGSVDIDGDTLTLYSGAGMGSGWATIDYKGRRFAISASQLVEAFLEVLDS